MPVNPEPSPLNDPENDPVIRELTSDSPKEPDNDPFDIIDGLKCFMINHFQSKL